jgi:hypothetical protein
MLTKDDLHSGDVIEVYLYGAWRSARVEFDHKHQAYILYLYDGKDLVGYLLFSAWLQMRRPE